MGMWNIFPTLNKMHAITPNHVPNTRKLYISKHKFIFHFDSTYTTFPLRSPPLHNDWYINNFYSKLTSSQKAKTPKFLAKLAPFDITTLPQIQDSHKYKILTSFEFQFKYHTKSKIIKHAL